MVTFSSAYTGHNVRETNVAPRTVNEDADDKKTKLTTVSLDIKAFIGIHNNRVVTS